MNFSFDGLSYNDIYDLQLSLEKMMSRSRSVPQWVLDLHTSIVHFWDEMEVASVQAAALGV